ncbi:MAG: Xaa-Pro aminopeptidase [Gammaproteobacteria bacterium]
MNHEEWVRRRRALAREMGPGTVAILPGAHEKIRNRDVHYRFRQDSDFLYLTGFSEPDAVMVLVPGRPEGEYLMFLRPRDRVHEIWTGRRLGPEGAIRELGADQAFPIGDIGKVLPEILEGAERIYYTMGQNEEFDHEIMSWINRLRERSRQGVVPPETFVSLDQLIHEMRLFKSAAEVVEMRKAARISVAAHRRVMARLAPGLHEYEVAAEVLHEFAREGCEEAYATIAGGGVNACVLHYVENRDLLCVGDLLLLDAGCESAGYASDITRTYPVSGRFSAEQRAIYNLVLAAQEAAIAACRIGHHWNEPHEATVRVITQGLIRLGLLKGPLRELIQDRAYETFYMHRAGHWLGLDVHDVGSYKVDGDWRELEPGMVLTVEPGIYIRPGLRGIPRGFQGIGIRIEDDVRITRREPDVLTRGLVKTASAIETVMQSRRL